MTIFDMIIPCKALHWGFGQGPFNGFGKFQQKTKLKALGAWLPLWCITSSKYPQEESRLETLWTFSQFSAKGLREIRWQEIYQKRESFPRTDWDCIIGTEGWKFGQGKCLVLLSPPPNHQAFLLLINIVLQILWTFNFYDVNRDGCISRDEMMKVWVGTKWWRYE